MGKTKHRLAGILLTACFALSALSVTTLLPKRAFAHAEEDATATENALNEKLIVKYSMDDTDTAEGKKIAAYKWDTASQAFVANTSADATIQNSVPNKSAGTVSTAGGVEGSGALTFTGSAHARASFRLPVLASGMTVSMWVKNVNSYWSSLIEFWDGTNGGRFGKGTMQGNGGRKNEGDAWSSNCPAHNSATIAPGGGWDSFCINVNSNDNGGAAVDPMKADTWYHVAYVVTNSEVKAYRNGELKQTFNKGNSASIASSIMSAAKNLTGGNLGIRLSLDPNDGDILDDLRIYNGALSADEIRLSYDKLGDLISAMPEYYEVEGLGYPEELLFDGAESVTESDGTMSGVTSKGVSYSYTPLTLGVNDTTPANDEKGIEVAFSKNGMTLTSTVKFRRTLKLEAESLGYQIGDDTRVTLQVPVHAGEDIIAKVAAGTDLSSVTGWNLSVKKLHDDSNADKYKTQFTYSASTHTAFVRCSYEGYAQFDTIYTIKFVEKNTETFTSLTVTGGKSATVLNIADFEDHNQAAIAVNDLANFSLNLTFSLAEGAHLQGGGNTVTFTQSDLKSGVLCFTIISENGDLSSYFLEVVAISSDASLSGPITAGNYTLQGSGNEYTVTINKGEVTKLLAAITATPTSKKATVVKSYDAAESKITVTVMAEDGVTVERYTIAVTELDTDATLAQITIGGAALEGFDPAKTEYTYKYKGTVPSVAATAASSTAQQPAISAVTDGKVTITVTAENGTTKVYTVTFVLMNSNATLTKLTLNGTVITFTENAATYEAPAGTQLNTLSVIAEVSEGATAAYKLNGNQLIITVTAEDGTTATYTVSVTVAAATLPEGGVTEDNSPKTSGCSSSLSGTAIAVTMVTLAVGVGLFLK